MSIKNAKKLRLFALGHCLALALAGCGQPLDEEIEDPAEQAIAQHLAVAEYSGPGAEGQYQNSLEELRRHGAQVMRVVMPMYRATPPSTYGKRFRLVRLISELERKDAVDPLVEIAQTPVPGRQPPPPQWGNASQGPDPEYGPEGYENETRIRLQAVHGLERLAGQGDGPALAGLRGLLRRPDSYAAEQSALALRRLAGKDAIRIQELQALLPPNLQWVMNG